MGYILCLIYQGEGQEAHVMVILHPIAFGYKQKIRFFFFGGESCANHN